MLVASVALQIPLYQTFDYLFLNSSLVVGTRVRISFGKRKVIGIVTEIKKNTSIKSNKLKFIEEILDKESIFQESIWQILNWSTKYYHYPIGKILFHALPRLLRKERSEKIKSIRNISTVKEVHNLFENNLKELLQERRTSQYLTNIQIYQNQQKQFICYRKKIQKCNLQRLYDLNKQQTFTEGWQKDSNKKHLHLSTEQVSTIITIRKEENQYVAWLIIDSTRFGLNKIYLIILEKILSQRKQALILVPEINLTLQIIFQLKNYLNVPIEVMHSKLSATKELSVWLKAKSGECAIVIGTRSALFIPFIRLGIIILDEEHHSSYKEKKGWKYHARDLAILRAKKENIPIILITSTPSLETLNNVKKKKYRQISLINKKNKNTCAVLSTLLDMKGLPTIHGIAISLIRKIREHLKKNHQVVLFINRRGFAPIVLCHKCGWIAKCRNCDYQYTFYKNKQLLCHRCNDQRSFPQKCSNCQSTKIITVGFGTEQIEETLLNIFPTTPVIRIDSDSVSKNTSYKTLLSNNAKIFVGTQVLTKNYHFLKASLVVLLGIDNVLFSENFRAFERFAQLYSEISISNYYNNQLKEILLQTYYPEHPTFHALLHNDYINFASYILEEREQASLPPFVSHILFRSSDRISKRARVFLNQLQKIFANCSLYDNNLWVIGPTPSSKHKCNNRFYWQLLLSHPSRFQLSNLVHSKLRLINDLSNKQHVKWSIDVDPIEN